MANNDQLLEKIGKVIEQKLESINQRLGTLEQGQAQTTTALGQINTAVEALEAGQDDIREQLVTKADKADIQDLKAEVVKKIKDHAERIEDLNPQ